MLQVQVLYRPPRFTQRGQPAGRFGRAMEDDVEMLDVMNVRLRMWGCGGISLRSLFVLSFCLVASADETSISDDLVLDVPSATSGVASSQGEKKLAQLVAAQAEEITALKKRLKSLESRDTVSVSVDKLLDSADQVPALKLELQALGNMLRATQVRLQYNLGTLHMRLKEYSQAEVAFLQVLALSPNDSATHYNLGILYDDFLDHPDKARHHYVQFLELEPKSIDAKEVSLWLRTLRTRALR